MIGVGRQGKFLYVIEVEGLAARFGITIDKFKF